MINDEFSAVLDLHFALDRLKKAVGYQVRSKNPDCKGSELELIEKELKNLPEYRAKVITAFEKWKELIER